MRETQFLNRIGEGIEAGRAHWSMRMRSMVQAEKPGMYELLDWENDAIYLEPLLFSYQSAPFADFTLEQILFASFEPEKRPKTIKVLADASHMVYLPQIGYFQLPDRSPKKVLLDYDYRKNSYSFYRIRSKALLEHNFIACTMLSDGKMELYRQSNPLLDIRIVNQTGEKRKVKILGNELELKERIEKLMLKLKQLHPAYYSRIEQVLRGIMLFESREIESFATKNALGIAFINVKPKASALYLLEKLAQILGQLIATFYFFDPTRFFAIDPHTALKHYTSQEDQQAGILDVTGDLFATHTMIEIFALYGQERKGDRQQDHEWKARLAHALWRMDNLLKALDYPHFFTDDGLLLYRDMKSGADEIRLKYASELQDCDLSGQATVFSYDLYFTKNPIR